MGEDRASVSASGRTRGRFPPLLAWFLSGVVAAPTCTLAHELGHYVVGWAFAFPDLEFHGDSVSSSAMADGFPGWQLGFMALAGPTTTLLFAAVATGVSVWRPGCFSIGIALTNLIRPVAVGVRHALPLVGTDSLCDETVAAAHFDLPAWTFVAGGLVVALLLLCALLVQTRHWSTVPRLLSMLVGAVGGMLGFLYVALPLVSR